MPTVETGTIQDTLTGTIAVLLAAACWALSGIFAKLIMVDDQVSSLTLAFWRDTAAFVVFLILAAGTERKSMAIRRPDWPVIAGMGVSLGVFHVALNLGYRLNGAAITTIQQAAMPAMVLVVARMIWKEPLTGLKIFSLTAIAMGTVLVSGLIQAGTPDVSVAGIAVGFLVPALYAGWSLFGKALRSGYSAVVTLAWAFGIASLILLPGQLFTGSLLPPPVPAKAYLWFGGLIGISTVFYAHLFLGENLSPIEIAGALVVVAGVILLLAPGAATKAIRPTRHR